LVDIKERKGHTVTRHGHVTKRPVYSPWESIPTIPGPFILNTLHSHFFVLNATVGWNITPSSQRCGGGETPATQ
jgi:hypothetical protein